MSAVTLLDLLAIAVLVVVAGIFAGAETALTRVSKARAEALTDEDGSGAAALRELLQHRGRSLGPLVLLALAAELGAATIVARMVEGGAWVMFGVLIVEVLVIFAVAEAIPRAWALSRLNSSATAAARLARALAAIPPLRWLGGGLTSVFDGDAELAETAGEVSEEELLAFADEAAASAAIDEEERELIEHIIEFGDTIATEVMVPRPDIEAIRVEATVADAIATVIELGYSRVPVFVDGIDDIVGIVHSKDLMRAERDGHEAESVAMVMRDPVFVPESKRIAMLLREMQSEMFHMAILIDEYGGTAGLVTLEDLIEEVVGEIVDEFDVEAPMIEALPGGRYRVNGRAALDDLGDMLGAELPTGEWSTVGGLIFNWLGHVPVVGEVVRLDGHELRVERVQGRRIARVVVERVAQPTLSVTDTEGRVNAL